LSIEPQLGCGSWNAMVESEVIRVLVTLSYVFGQRYSEIAPSDSSFKKLK
jgi:hypothetical protein